MILVDTSTRLIHHPATLHLPLQNRLIPGLDHGCIGSSQSAQERLLWKLDEAKDWTFHRLEKLTGHPYYKLRAGDYRAIIAWNREDGRLIVEAVGHRRNIYDWHLSP